MIKFMKHLFDVEMAVEYGVNCAIILENFCYWIEKNKANQINFYDGYYWTYNSVRAFNELFPYMSQKQITTAIKKLEEEQLIISGNYNKLPWDRTKWYALTEKGYSILQKSNIHYPKMSNGTLQKDEPIPNINTNSKQNNKTNNKNNVVNDIYTPQIKEVIDYLNEKSKKNFRHTTKKTQTLIKGLLKNNYTVEDIKKVIDIKVKQWGKDKKMKIYLRPETLFGSKFEAYLNEEPNKEVYEVKIDHEDLAKYNDVEIDF